jgi:predicted permease
MGYEVDVIQVGCSCLLLIGIGFVLSRFQIMGAAEFRILGAFNSAVSFPFLLYRSLASRKIKDLSFMPLVDALLMSASTQLLVGLITFILPLKDSLYMYLSTVISSAYINYIILGLPIFNSIWGTEYNHVPAICTLTHYVLLVPMFLILSQLWQVRKARQEKIEERKQNPDLDDGEPLPEARITCRDVINAFVTALKTPLVVGIFVGLLSSAAGVPYVLFFDSLASYMGDIVLVYALIGIGRFLQINSILNCNWLQLLACLIIRFFVCPGFAALYAWILRFNGRLARQCTILSCLPAANAGFVLANTAGIGAGEASAMVFWTLILIMPILMFWFFIFNHFGIFPEDE